MDNIEKENDNYYESTDVDSTSDEYENDDTDNWSEDENNDKVEMVKAEIIEENTNTSLTGNEIIDFIIKTVVGENFWNLKHYENNITIEKVKSEEI